MRGQLAGGLQNALTHLGSTRATASRGGVIVPASRDLVTRQAGLSLTEQAAADQAEQRAEAERVSAARTAMQLEQEARRAEAKAEQIDPEED
jgi:hypothetical protein